MKTMKWAVVVAIAAMLSACTEDGGGNTTTVDTGGTEDAAVDQSTGEDGATDTPAGQGLTYHKDVRPIFEQNCVACHQDGGIAPDDFHFTDFAVVEEKVEFIKTQVSGRTMPPFQAHESCNDYKDSLRLSEDDVQTVVDWVDAGAPEGDEADFVARDPKPANPDLRSIDRAPELTVTPPAVYEAAEGKVDDYRCQVVDPEFAVDRWMQGYEVVVDNAEILHHLIIYTVPPGNDDAIATLEAEDELPGWECFGGPRTPSPSVASIWAPGGSKTAFPQGSGLAIPAGTKFVVQSHYNMTSIETAEKKTDNSSVDLWFLPEDGYPARQGQMVFIGNMPFQIPAGISGDGSEECDIIYDTFNMENPPPPASAGMHSDEIYDDLTKIREIGKSGCVQQEFYYHNPQPTKLWGIGPHMHLSGTSIKIEIAPVDDSGAEMTIAEEDSTCIADVRKWDFDWQWLYWLEDAITVPETGVIRLTCEYNNRLGSEPVNIGDGSGDEMCLGIFFLTTGL